MSMLRHDLTDYDWEQINKVANETFNNPEWNWGSRSDFKLKNSKRFKQGTYEFYVDVEYGAVVNCELLGDFFVKKDIHKIADSLKGVEFQSSAIQKVLNRLQLTDYIENLTTEQLLTLIFNEEEDEKK